MNSGGSTGTVCLGSTGICGMVEIGDSRVVDGEEHCDVEGNSSGAEDVLSGIVEESVGVS